MGQHLIIDGYDVVSKTKLDDLDYIYRLLDDLPKMIGMDVLIPPIVCKCKVANNLGITGVTIITTSHLTIHTWPDRNYFSFDCYSCQKFDEEFITLEVRRRFEPCNLVTTVFERELPAIGEKHGR